MNDGAKTWYSPDGHLPEKPEKKMPATTLIPTPVETNFTNEKIHFTGLKADNASVAAPYSIEMLGKLLKKNGNGRILFEHMKHKSSQAYSINIDGSKITVAASGSAGFIYAASTLIQLAEFKDDEIIFPEGKVFDCPKFENRGVSWNLFVELRGWSQDACDGKDAFIERSVNGLDIMAFFKLNLAFVDGIGWNPGRFPEYSALMRKLNGEARRRGIKLIFSGYNAGYGAQWYDSDGPKFQNRKSYPDGEVYSCLDPLRCSEIGSTMGTCLSNQALMNLKKNNLKQFIHAVEPGMFYMHGMDIAYQDEAEKAWATRCPECRKRWPDNSINSEKGMAGAFAEFYDELYEAIISVRNPETGYDASKDCIVGMVSPNYTSYTESDEEWKFHVEYFKVLSRHIKNKNKKLCFILREQFFNKKEGSPRLDEFFKAVGSECGFGTVYFSSGSTFYNSYPVTADAACVKYFKGMDTVISGSGNAFQEPRQAITAEYLWNPDSPYSFELPDSASGKDFIPFYHDLRYARILPNEIFGENGLLERACSVLYGTEAGKLVAENHKPSPLLGLEPEPIEARGAVKTISVAPVFPLCNHILPGNYFSIFNKFRKIYWREGLTFSEIDYVERCLKILPAAIGLTRKAADRFAKSVPLCDSALPLCPEARGKHLERMSETCKSGVALAGFTFRWLEIFIDAYGVAVCGGSGLEALKKRAEALLGDVETSAVFFREATGKAVDPVKADSGYGFETCEYIMRDLKNIVYTLKTGKFKKVEKQPWW